jgi:peroxin-19
MLKELESVGNLGATTEQALDSGSTQAFSTTNKATSSTGGEDSFQETIRRTIERMQVSGEQATAAAVADDSNDILTELMKQMQTEGLDGEGNEEELSKMLLGMMEQLTNKDILYEPMKELNNKFPEWIDKNRATVPIEDMKRYEEQRKVVYEIVAKFEEKTYADSNVTDREYIVDRMQKARSFLPILATYWLTNFRCKRLDPRLLT